MYPSYIGNAYQQGFIQAILMQVIRHKKLNLSIEFENSILVYIFVFFCLSFYWDIGVHLFTSSVKLKTYLHASYRQLNNYLHIRNITYITYLDIWKNENLKPWYFSWYNKCPINKLFLQPRERNLLGRSLYIKCTKLHFFKRLSLAALFWNWKTHIKQNYLCSASKWSCWRLNFPALSTCTSKQYCKGTCFSVTPVNQL